MKKQATKKAKSNLGLKIMLPLIIILFVIGMLYWSSETMQVEGNKPQHQMADGVAKFYATFRKSFMPGATQLDDYTIELPKPSQSLTEQLQARAEIVKPASPAWRGEKKRRSFQENDTIRSALTEFGKEENVEVIWDLKYDYIIKNHFQENSNFKQLAEKVSKTVSGDHGGMVKAYFCPQERTIVISASDNQYVKEFCQPTTSARRLAIDKKREADYKLRQKLGLN